MFKRLIINLDIVKHNTNYSSNVLAGSLLRNMTMEESSEGVKLAVRVVPNASSNEIEGWHQDETGADELKIRVTAAPEKGKANKAVIELLSKSLKIGKSKIVILQGGTGKRKKIFLYEVTLKDMQTMNTK